MPADRAQEALVSEGTMSTNSQGPYLHNFMAESRRFESVRMNILLASRSMSTVYGSFLPESADSKSNSFRNGIHCVRAAGRAICFVFWGILMSPWIRI